MFTNSQFAVLAVAGSLILASLAGSPIQAAVVDLTTTGSSGAFGGVQFVQGDPQPTGTGVIQSFVRINGKDVESGYNTDGALEFDTMGGAFTHSVQVKDLAETTIGGVAYRTFLLDVNQKSSSPLLSLDALKIHLESAANLTGYPGSFSAPVYDMGAGNHVLLNYSLGSGSGSGDMFALVPSALFGADDTKYVYLYSKFGEMEDAGANDGFEEWAYGKASTPPPPLTGSLTIVKFLDSDRDGIQDPGEPGLAGWDFSVTGPTVETLTTLAGGSVTDGALLAGTYTIEEINIPAGWVSTTTNPLTNVPITDGQGTTVFFGNIPEPATLSLLVLGAAAIMARRHRA